MQKSWEGKEGLLRRMEFRAQVGLWPYAPL